MKFYIVWKSPILWFIKSDISLLKAKRRNWKETKRKIKSFTVNFLNYITFLTYYAENGLFGNLWAPGRFISISFLSLGHVFNYSAS